MSIVRRGDKKEMVLEYKEAGDLTIFAITNWLMARI
jgi:hypothetical protein